MTKFLFTAMAGFALVLSLTSAASAAFSPPPACFTKCKNLVCPCYPSPPFARHCVQCLPGSGVTGFTSCTHEAMPPCGGQCPQLCFFSGSCTC